MCWSPANWAGGQILTSERDKARSQRLVKEGCMEEGFSHEQGRAFCIAEVCEPSEGGRTV